MKHIILTRLQNEILEASTWGTATPADMILFKEVPRGTTLPQIEAAAKQLVAKGLVRIRRGDIEITKLGELAREVIIAQEDLDTAEVNFTKEANRRASR